MLLNVLHYLYYHGLMNEISRNHDIYHGLMNEISRNHNIYHGLMNEISRNHDIYHGLMNEISPVRLFFKQGYEFSASLRTLANSS